MAKRKKTPDVLVAQKPQAHGPKPPNARKQRPSIAQPVRAPRQAKEESSNPYTALFPQQPVEKPLTVSARVKLEVTAFDDLAPKVQRCMSQALGALPNTQLVQVEADWTLIILGVPIQPPGGKIYGIALSAVATKTFDRLPASQSRARQESRTDSTSTAFAIPPRVFRGTWLRIGALAHLPRLCEQLVNDFSRRYLDLQHTASSA